jgi:hypothetical protein
LGLVVDPYGWGRVVPGFCEPWAQRHKPFGLAGTHAAVNARGLPRSQQFSHPQDQRSCVFQPRVGTTLGTTHHHIALAKRATPPGLSPSRMNP